MASADADGIARYDVNFATLPGSGAITPGSTWNFQYVYLDPFSAVRRTAERQLS